MVRCVGLAFASILSLAVTGVGAASAADLAARPYTKAPALVNSVYNWSGFYVGVNAGGLWANTGVTDVDAYAAAAVPGTVTSLNKSGFLGGGQIGYNWQVGQVVFGIEADGGYMDLGGTTLLTGTNSGTRVGLRSGAYGDITGRLGLAFNSALIYVKGGYAVLDDASSFSTVSGSFSGLTKHGTDSGYTIGGGLEYGFTPNWTAKVEYMHFDFGHDLNYTVFNAGGAPFLFNQSLRVDTVKIGVNYRFGGPVVARY
jgi:outer membrane immunogenic protein